MQFAEPVAGSRRALYHEFSRREWARLGEPAPWAVGDGELNGLAGAGGTLPAEEAGEVFLPLACLIGLHAAAAAGTRRAAGSFLRLGPGRVPFIVGITGSVGVGKSTSARLLQGLLSRLPDRPSVDLLTTDGFLYPNAELERRGLMMRKGFPESYDLGALVTFLSAVRWGDREVAAPAYSHLIADVVPDGHQVVAAPDILLVEGLGVLGGTPRNGHGPEVLVSDLLDFSVYIDADPADIRRWYIDRFLMLRDRALCDPQAYSSKYAQQLPADEARETAGRLWDGINYPNLVQHIRPARDQARVILEKAADHRVRRVLMRRF